MSGGERNAIAMSIPDPMWHCPSERARRGDCNWPDLCVSPRCLFEKDPAPPRNTSGYCQPSYTGSARDRLAGILDIVLRAPEGSRNISVYSAAGKACEAVDDGAGFTREQAFDAITRAGVSRGLSAAECHSTIRSACNRHDKSGVWS